MTDLKAMIIAAQNFDNDSMNSIITKFDPIIIKYSRILRSNEDYRSDLILHLIETVHSLDLSKFRIPNDYAIINYISKSLYHKYIELSKKSVRFRHAENYFKCDYMEDWLETEKTTTEDIDTVLLINTMEHLLTERESTCIKLMVIEEYTSTEVAKILGISRQTVNENKNRGLKKLKAFMI